MPSNPKLDLRQPYPVGYQRSGFPELVGWAEVVQMSQRTTTSVREMRARYSFPEPVVVLQTTPVYLKEEIQAFFDKFPRRAVIDGEMIERIRGLYEGGSSQARIAEILEINVNTVNKYLNQPV